MLTWNSEYSFMTLFDPAENVVSNVFYLKNSEKKNLPTVNAATISFPTAPVAKTPVHQLFR